jgi:hypothetical protein
VDLFKKVDAWLGGARADGGGLLIPGAKADRDCDLLLTADDVRLRLDDEQARLEYEAFDPSVNGRDVIAGVGPDLQGDLWCFGPWSLDHRGHEFGAAVLVSGSCAEAADGLVARVNGWRDRFSRGFADGTALPLSRSSLRGWAYAPRGLVVVLCALLRERPEWRSCLADRERVERLAADITARRYPPKQVSRGLRQRTWEMAQAMQTLGYQHEWYGRPLPGDRIADPDEIVPAVLEKIRASPYAQGLDVDSDDVRAFANKYYLNVDPWPFAALVEN